MLSTIPFAKLGTLLVQLTGRPLFFQKSDSCLSLRPHALGHIASLSQGAVVFGAELDVLYFTSLPIAVSSARRPWKAFRNLEAGTVRHIIHRLHRTLLCWESSNVASSWPVKL